MSPCQLAGVVCANGQETGMTSFAECGGAQRGLDWVYTQANATRTKVSAKKAKMHCPLTWEPMSCVVLFVLFFSVSGLSVCYVQRHAC